MLLKNISYAIAKIKALKTNDLAFCSGDTRGIYVGNAGNNPYFSRTTYAAT
jgi:hypothetical protein